jgi:UDP-N-acetylmuramate dehydrogenase
MNAAHQIAFDTNLLERLPTVRGEYVENSPLSRYSWFRTGGPAEVLFKPKDADDLAAFMDGKPDNVPVTVIGVGSNLLIRDGGVAGVVVRLGKGFSCVSVRQDHILAAGGALDVSVAAAARDAGLAGLEFLTGIPGTIGGALKMNAGAYEREMRDIVLYVRVVDNEGNQRHMRADELDFDYRHTNLPDDWIVVGVVMQGVRGDRGVIARRMEQIRTEREDTQPVRTKTGGSTFRNPDPVDSGGRKAWQLIDDAGCRGLVRGGAMISDKHCNFLINTGDATSDDLEELGNDVQRRVFGRTGVEIHWEIRRIGMPLNEDDRR